MRVREAIGVACTREAPWRVWFVRVSGRLRAGDAPRGEIKDKRHPRSAAVRAQQQQAPI